MSRQGVPTQLVALVGALVILVCSRPAAAQAGTVRGTVTSTANQPMERAIVSISSLNLRQFTNSQGKFYFVQLPPGTYQVSVRQLGYLPATAQVTVVAAGNADIAVRMQQIVTTLAAMQVSAEWQCTAPGSPAPGSDRQLIDVFEQLEQNAVRLRLLHEEYPFEVTTERRYGLQRANGTTTVERVDTLRAEIAPRALYKPGNVVKRVPSMRRPADYTMQVPTLLDFADSVFQANHCFRVRGLDERGGEPMIRVDFQAWAKLKSPDVAGSVFLEPGTFRLREAEIRLTRIPGDLQQLASVVALTSFDDVVQGMPAVKGIVATTQFKRRRGPEQYERAVETQKTLVVRFLKNRPDSPPPE